MAYGCPSAKGSDVYWIIKWAIMITYDIKDCGVGNAWCIVGGGLAREDGPHPTPPCRGTMDSTTQGLIHKHYTEHKNNMCLFPKLC